MKIYGVYIAGLHDRGEIENPRSLVPDSLASRMWVAAMCVCGWVFRGLRKGWCKHRRLTGSLIVYAGFSSDIFMKVQFTGRKVVRVTVQLNDRRVIYVYDHNNVAFFFRITFDKYREKSMSKAFTRVIVHLYTRIIKFSEIN